MEETDYCLALPRELHCCDGGYLPVEMGMKSSRGLSATEKSILSGSYDYLSRNDKGTYMPLPQSLVLTTLP